MTCYFGNPAAAVKQRIVEAEHHDQSVRRRDDVAKCQQRVGHVAVVSSAADKRVSPGECGATNQTLADSDHDGVLARAVEPSR